MPAARGRPVGAGVFPTHLGGGICSSRTAQLVAGAPRSSHLNGERTVGISGGVQGSGAIGRLAGVSEPRVREQQALSTSNPVTRGEDKVELSQEAQVLAPWLDKLNQLPAVRQELVDRVRGEIANGTYDTADRLNAALDGMIDETQSGQIC